MVNNAIKQTTDTPTDTTNGLAGSSTIDIESLLTQAQAAQMTGRTRASIHKLVQRGKIPTVKILGKRFITPETVQAIINAGVSVGGRGNKFQLENNCENKC